MRRYDGEQLEEFSNRFTKFKNPNKVMMWGAICYNSQRRLEFIDGTLNSDNYLAILKRNLPKIKELWSREWIF